MKVIIIDDNGTGWGEFNETMIDRVKVFMPVTIDGLANEQGIQITVHAEPVIGRDTDDGCCDLTIRPAGEPAPILWVRLGDNAEYQKVGNPYEAGELVGEFTSDTSPHWRNLGVEVGGFAGLNYISLFWGDRKAQPTDLPNLSGEERGAFERGLKEAQR